MPILTFAIPRQDRHPDLRPEIVVDTWPNISHYNLYRLHGRSLPLSPRKLHHYFPAADFNPEWSRQYEVTGMVRFFPHGLLALLMVCTVANTGLADEPAGPAQALLTYPPKVTLNGPREYQHLGVLGKFGSGQMWDLVPSAKFTSANPKIAAVDA